MPTSFVQRSEDIVDDQDVESLIREGRLIILTFSSSSIDLLTSVWCRGVINGWSTY